MRGSILTLQYPVRAWIELPGHRILNRIANKLVLGLQKIVDGTEEFDK